MSTSIGRRAVVIGAGIAGSVSARVLADYFDEVLVLERDTLPGVPDHRPGTPQSRFTHSLMAGGMQALRGLFPALERHLRSERPDYNPFPQRETDVVAYCASRPLIEHCVHKSTRQQGNIAFIAGQRVVSLVTTADGKAVTGVRSEAAGQAIHTIAADLVVDASGRGGMRGEKPPGDWAGVQDFLRSLRTRTIHDAISRAERADGINRFALPSEHILQRPDNPTRPHFAPRSPRSADTARPPPRLGRVQPIPVCPIARTLWSAAPRTVKPANRPSGVQRQSGDDQRLARQPRPPQR